MNFNNKDEVALIHKHLSTEVYINCGISLAWIETVRKYIEYLETKIKELTEDVERVAKQCGEIIVECDERDAKRLHQVGEYAAKVRELTEENERLRDLLDEVVNSNAAWVDDNVRLRKEMKTLKADTVKKMQERFENSFDKLEEYYNEESHENMVYSNKVLELIDQIAKELLEENK